MIVDALFQANRMALDHERARIEAAANNIAEANTPLAPNQAARRHAAAPLSFVDLLPSADASGSQLLTEPAAIRKVLDPDHPYADAEGNVSFPEVDLVTEMTDLMSASRGYEANVRALNMLRSMVLKSLEIGRS